MMEWSQAMKGWQWMG